MTSQQWVPVELNREKPLSTNGISRSRYPSLKSAFAVLAASVLAVASLGLAAPAVAAPSGTGSAQDTINELQANGFKVILNRFGDAPLDQCAVTSIRPGREITEARTGSGGDLIQVVLYTTVYVAVSC
ncbi:MAG: hypothetical protein QOH60_2378 [Mycobacterium sp.]|jgi:hypothetical protein|nr:hypothetical protein [Mycobacterium sp.]